MKLVYFGMVIAALQVNYGITTAQAQPDDAAVSIVFVGDIMLAETPGKVVRSGRDPFAPIAPILDSADIRVGNLECVVAGNGTPEPGKPYTFRAHPRTLSVLKRHFDALVLANNHSGDYGPVAFGQMLDLLDQHGLGYFGGGRTLAQAHKPLIIERKGLRIAFLGYDEFFPRSFEADVDKAGIAWSEDEQVQYDIRHARTNDHADLVIPVMHWGVEHERTASIRQRQLARIMIEAGADAVIGGHPHVTQDVEQYQGKPIIYSLGNFLFDGFSSDDNNTGWILKMELNHAGVIGWRVISTHIDHQGVPHPQVGIDDACWSEGQHKLVACK